MADEFNKNKLVNSGNFKALAERVAGKIDSVRGQLEGSIGDLEGKLEGVDGTVADKIATAKQEALQAAAEAKAAADAAQSDVTALEGKVGELPTGITSTTVVGYIGEKVAAEKTRAEAKEGELEAAINALKGEGTGSVTEQIAAAKQELQGKINTVSQAAQAAQGAADNAQVAADKAQGEVDALEGVVSTLDKKVDQQKTDLQGAINGEKADREAADALLQEAIDAINNGENGILKQANAYTDQKVGAEATARQTGDADTLASAKAYADQKITGLVDSAPDAMNTLGELAQAIKDHQDVYKGYVETVTADIAKAKGEAIAAAKTETTTQVGAAKTELQGKIDAVSGVADAAKAQADTNKSDIATLNGDVNTAGSVAAKIKAQADAQALIDQAQDGRLDAVEGKVTTLETEMDAVEVRATGLEGRMTTAEGAIEALEAKDTQLLGKIEALETAVGKESVADQVKEVSDALAAHKEAQTARDNAQDKAISDAEDRAKTYAEEKAAAAQQAAAQDATTKADAAEANAKTYAETKATAAQQAAAQDATTKANKALEDAKTDAAAKDAALEGKVVSTFNALDLVVHTDNKIHVALPGNTMGVTTPLGKGIEFMTDGEVADMLDDIFSE